MEDMLKAYIIKSRIREADKILLAQAYSPHLFRQGVLPGPGLLLEVLLGKKTTSDAKAAWKKYEKEKSERAKAPFLEISCLLGLRFGSLDASKGSILRVLGSLWAPFLVTFEGPEAPGHAPGASLCSKGGLDRFLERFWEPNGRPRKPKCLSKSI